jgi:hypothetical protein
MKEARTRIGFLVVETRHPGDSFADSDNPRYEGVWRIPAWPPDLAQEEDAMWDYVFSPDVKDHETNMIPSLDKARAMHARLSQGGRAFEIIFCCRGPDSEDLDLLGSAPWEYLGYDIAAIGGDYYSIVADLWRADWAAPFRQKLNEHGLFAESDADDYLQQYVAHGEPGADSNWSLVCVIRVLPPYQ